MAERLLFHPLPDSSHARAAVDDATSALDYLAGSVVADCPQSTLDCLRDLERAANRLLGHVRICREQLEAVGVVEGVTSVEDL